MGLGLARRVRDRFGRSQALATKSYPSGVRNNGRQFEDLTEEVFRALASDPLNGEVQIDRNVLMEGADGAREVDVRLMSHVGPIELTTILECRDYGRNVDITHVDGLHSKMQDVHASKAAIVSRRGFSKKAEAKARRLGMGLYTLDHMSGIGGEAGQVPIHVCELTPDLFEFEASSHCQPADEELAMINDRPSNEVILEHVVDSGVLHAAGPGLHDWINLDQPLYVRDESADQVPVEYFRYRFTLNVQHFLGYLGDLDSVLRLHDVLEESDEFVLRDPDFVEEYPLTLSPVSERDLPDTEVMHTYYTLGIPENGYLGEPQGLWMSRGQA